MCGLGSTTWVSRLCETTPSYDFTVGLYLRPYGGLRGVAVTHERGTPVEDLEMQKLLDIDFVEALQPCPTFSFIIYIYVYILIHSRSLDTVY